MRLPRALVEVVNGLDQQRHIDYEVWQRAWSELDAWDCWLELESGFWVDDDDRQDLLLVAEGLGHLRDHLESWDGERLYACLCQVDEAMGRVNLRRQRNPYSPLPAFHQVILACGAVVIGQGEWPALALRWTVLEQFLCNFEAAFGSHVDSLPEEARDSLEQALEHAHQALGEGRQACLEEDTAALRRALATLGSAGQILEFLPRRHQQLHHQMEQESWLRIPLIGARLSLDPQALSRSDDDHWGQTSTHRLQESLPVLRAYMDSEGPGVLLSTSDAGLWQEVEVALEHLAACYREKPSEAQLRQALTATSDLFARIEQARLKVETLPSPLAQRCARICQGVLRRDLPERALIALLAELASLSGWASVREYLEAFLDSGQPELLHQAAYAAVEASQSGSGPLSILAE